MAEEKTVTYAPQIVCGISEIGKTFGVGRRRVLQWIDMGAPIAITGIQSGSIRYSAEILRLQLWLEQHDAKTRET